MRSQQDKQYLSQRGFEIAGEHPSKTSIEEPPYVCLREPEVSFPSIEYHGNYWEKNYLTASPFTHEDNELVRLIEELIITNKSPDPPAKIKIFFRDKSWVSIARGLISKYPPKNSKQRS